MGAGGSLINLGELSKPATVLIEKISDAIGGIFRPHQIRRIAQAQAEADRIQATSQIEISALQRRAVERFFIEEAKKQQNIESITEKALLQIQETAEPGKVEDDWITNFFDKCRLISDVEMQTLWSKVLAGEANNPGQYSKRTVSLLSSLDKSDAELFRNLGSFSSSIKNSTAGCFPLVFDVTDTIYKGAGLNFYNLRHLDSIGLLSFDQAGFRLTGFPKKDVVRYYGRVIQIEFPNSEENNLNIGTVLLSKAGWQLGLICGSVPCPGFVEYAIERWRGMAVRLSGSSIV